jgi:hypothetical protein
VVNGAGFGAFSSLLVNHVRQLAFPRQVPNRRRFVKILMAAGPANRAYCR